MKAYLLLSYHTTIFVKFASRLTAFPNNDFTTHIGIIRETHGWRCTTSGRKSGRTVVFDRTYFQATRRVCLSALENRRRLCVQRELNLAAFFDS